MELVLLLLGVAAAVLVLRYAFKKYDAQMNNKEFDVHPVDFAKEEVKNVLDVNDDGKVDLADVKEAAVKTKKAIKATKAAVKKTAGRKKKSAE